MQLLKASIDQCRTCPIFQHTLWAVLGREEIQYLDKFRRLYTYIKNELIFRQGDDSLGLYCIVSGYISLKHIDAIGKQTVFAVLGPGQVTGYRSFFAKQPHFATARSLTNSCLCYIPAEVVSTLLMRNSSLCFKMMETIARDPGPAAAPLLRDPYLPVQKRLLRLLLLLLKDEFAITKTDDAQAVYNLPVTRQDLAAMIGSRPESLSRAIRELRTANIALFSGQHLTIPDFGRFRQLAGVNNDLS